MKMISWNVNSLKTVMKKGFMNFLNKYNPDILFLQEIKTNIVPIEFYNTKYIVYINPCKFKAGYSGVMALTKYKPISYRYGIGEEKFDIEGRVITLEYNKIYFINVYFPNAGVGTLKRLNLKLEFDEKFEEYVSNLKKPFIIGGDFNVAHLDIDVYDPEKVRGEAGFTDEERKWFDEFLKKGYIDVLRMKYNGKGYYTWYSFRKWAKEKNIGWRLDYFIISPELKDRVIDIKILKEVDGSDHVPILLDINVEDLL